MNKYSLSMTVFSSAFLILLLLPIDTNLNHTWASTTSNDKVIGQTGDNSQSTANQIDTTNQMNDQDPMCIAGLSTDNDCNASNEQTASGGGERGPPGIQGPPGEQGPPGTNTGFYLRYQPYEVNLEFNTGKLYDVSCDEGDVATGGGYEFGGGGYRSLHVTENRPSYGDPPPNWFVTLIASEEVSNIPLTVFAVCANTNQN